ncbi:MAG: protein BatD [Candidatus Omnitrophica bacterium]|nr:protein BatD [Candidatus Omnitrophota bacterium]
MKDLKQKLKIQSLERVFILFLIIVSVSSISLAEDISFEVTADRNKVYLGSIVRLDLNFYGTQNIPPPDLPDIEGFKWQYLGPSSRISIVNGVTSTSITYMYTLHPLRTGIFQIPPLVVHYKGRTYTSNPIQIEVEKSQFGQTSRSVEEKAYDEKLSGLEDRVFLIMEAGKKRAYINEIIPVMIKFYVRRLSVRDIQYPQFSHEGFLVDKYDKPRQYREVLSGNLYEVVEFTTNVYGIRPGQLKLGPAELKCNLLIKKSRRRRSSSFDDDFFSSDPFDDFFEHYERHPLNLTSLNIPVTITELPKEDVPAGFKGAIGDYRFYLECDPKEIKAGDPITLKMTITGEGNFKTVEAPSLGLGDGFKVYDPESKQEANRKIFEQVVIPKDDKIKEIPRIIFSFFNTKTGDYHTVAKGPIPITVRPLPKGEELRVFEAPAAPRGETGRMEILGRDIIYIKDAPGTLRRKDDFLYKNRLFIVLQFIPLLTVMGLFLFQKRRERLQRDVRYARRIRAPRKARKNLRMAHGLLAAGKPAEFYNAVFKALQEYLGDKFHLPTGGITSDVVEDLSRRNINGDILNKLKECFADCDMARYAPSSITREDMDKTYRLFGEIIDRLERIKI